MAPTRSEERMSTLGSLDALDDVVSSSLDRLTELATRLFQTEVAFVSLVETNRQRMIARQGLEPGEMQIEHSICAHTIRSADGLVVADLRADPRFAGNPLVVDPPHLRFYAGAPLVAKNGVAIGALCVMDPATRAFSPDDRRQLQTLAIAVMNELELRVLTGRRDPVSGLPNRHQFTLDYAAWSARAPGRTCFAVLVDVLDLPRANEAGQVLGMAPLEALIRRAGARIKVALEGVCEVYHVGVTRFAFVLQLPDRDAAERLVTELHGRLTRSMLAAAVPMAPLFHAGLCEVQLGRDSADDVLRHMLIGLHSAHSAGAPFCWYSAKRDAGLKRGYRLATDAESGLRNDEFHLVYQPRYRASDLVPVAAEVLLRWQHPDLGAVSPAEFIPVFERTALMEVVTDWVLDHALTQLAQWRRDGLSLVLSINLSPRDVARAGMADSLITRIQMHGLSCHDIEIEITEGEWLRADSPPGEQLKLLAAAGVRIAVDDFGSGYSNFGYLTDLPISTIKLDKSMIDDLPTDARAQLKVQAVISLAHGLGYNTVAEGAETAEQVALLRAYGCDEIQGFALSRPVDASALAALQTVPYVPA
ncbi:GGDEF and EAL domain-containing protein [Stenotrophomonas sp. PFBMAA-4]|uniref:putative bifunctional diguanylate cyclase/phosphodiesterase n=1 Tax=Stenotrophomonas sp. PFBMAA-4 TaxID=3043301 RepID=UPI0024B62B2C|nr:GGDEF and EAL domain-containing protein [Stenotrophomonas sp. PFBMAA-4]MDI9272075.1 sensor domain-containing phosphodiesterase [Stenotrophomonas sp. PFBMAA-4]